MFTTETQVTVLPVILASLHPVIRKARLEYFKDDTGLTLCLGVSVVNFPPSEGKNYKGRATRTPVARPIAFTYSGKVDLVISTTPPDNGACSTRSTPSLPRYPKAA